jgi:methionine-rich copper-binding protein CopC
VKTHVVKACAVKTSRVVAFVLLALVALTVGLDAHMKLQKSDPVAGATLTATPKTVSLFYTQKPDLKVTKLSLKGPVGEVKLGVAHMMGDTQLMATVDGEAPDGAYTLSWQTAGDDGHVQKGTIAFTLKRRTE